jgi:hypothetical protein
MLQGVPAFIMRLLFAALFYPAPVRQRGLHFAPPCAVRGTSGGETMTTPGGAGTPYEHATYSPCSAHRLLSWGRSSLAQRSGPSLRPGPRPQGVSYVRYEHEHANLYIRKHNAHQSTSGPLPCTIEAITRSGTDTPSSRPTGPFFTQRRGTGFLRR